MIKWIKRFLNNYNERKKQYWERMLFVCEANEYKREEKYAGIFEIINCREYLNKETLERKAETLYIRHAQGKFMIGQFWPTKKFQVIEVISNPENQYDNVLIIREIKES